MITTLQDGRLEQINEAVEQCGQGKAALLITVLDTETSDAVANTRVHVVWAAVELDDVAQTDGEGNVTVVFDEVGDDQIPAGPVVVRDEHDATDRYEFQAPPLQRQEWRGRMAYFGPIYTVEPLWHGPAIDDARFAAEFELREGEVALHEGTALRAEHRYSLLIEDAHSLEDATDDGLLGEAGDVTSKAADYTAKNWWGSISPGVPLKARILCRRNGAEVKITDADALSVRWRVIDPPPDFVAENGAMNPAGPIAWLRSTYALYQPDVQEEWEGNTNCPKAMGGARENKGRIKATTVLRRAADKEPLPAAGDDDHVVDVAVAETEGNHGEALVYFCPPPTAGDSYEFELTVRHAGRDIFVERAPADMIARTETGRITVWLKIAFKLFGGVEGVDLDSFRWPAIKAAYAAAYIEVDSAAQVVEELTEQATRDGIQAVYPRQSMMINYGFNRDHLLPGYISTDYPNTINDRLDQVTHVLTSQLCTSNGLPDPNEVESTTDGFHLLLSKRLYEDCDIAGQYVGRGQFYMVQLHDYHETLAHELGHALYLRHALTAHESRMRPAANWNGAPANKCDVVPLDNWLDHDPCDSVACLMSYNNSHFDDEITTQVQWHFCGGCLLKLRFWDTVGLAADDAYKGLIRDSLLSPEAAIVLVKDSMEGGCTTVDCRECLGIRQQPQVTGLDGETLVMRALVRPDLNQTQWSRECWIDLAGHPEAQWVSANPAVVAIDGENNITLTRPEVYPGPVRLEFTFNGVTSHVEVDVLADAPPFLEAIHARLLTITPVGVLGGRQPLQARSLPIKCYSLDMSAEVDGYLAFNGSRFIFATEADFGDAQFADGLELASPPEAQTNLTGVDSAYDAAYLLASVVNNTQFEVEYNHTYGDACTEPGLRYRDHQDRLWDLTFT